MSKNITPEGRVKTECLKYLNRRGFFAWNNPTGAVRIAPGRFMHFGKVGSSDILGILPGGRFLAIECKRPDGGRLSPEQKQFLDDVKNLGGIALVVRSWQELDNDLRQGGFINDGPLFSEGNSAC